MSVFFYFCIMTVTNIKKPIVLTVLFFLPVLFLLFLYPSKHNYEPLDIVKENIPELKEFKTFNGNPIALEDRLSVVGFFGETPMEDTTLALNLKELIYDKFFGFMRFQVLILLPLSAEAQARDLQKDLNAFAPLDYWTFAFGSEAAVKQAYTNFKIAKPLDDALASSDVFVVDRERNQRGRLDDRNETEIETNSTIYGLPSYDVLEVSVLKNKMSDDMRILFTEYRQKRKGNFNSTARRAQDLKQ